MTQAPVKPTYNGKTYRDIVDEHLRNSRVPAGAGEALVMLDQTLFQMSRQVLKGDLVAAFLRQEDCGLEPAVFQGLAAVVRVANGVGRPAPAQPTVGSLAEELNIDPSRASRIAAALIEKGYVRRAAAQDDGRKSVLEITARGGALLQAFFRFKWQRLVGIFEDWSEEEITTFSRLLGRYAGSLTPTGGGGT